MRGRTPTVAEAVAVAAAALLAVLLGAGLGVAAIHLDRDPARRTPVGVGPRVADRYPDNSRERVLERPRR